MADRRQFDAGDYDIEIFMHPDGTLTIEATAEYGDSYTGFGSTTKTIYMDADKVRDFAKFLIG